MVYAGINWIVIPNWTKHCIIFSLVLLLFVRLGQCQSYLVETFDNNDQAWPFVGIGDENIIQLENGHLTLDGRTNAIQTFKNVGLSEEMDFAIYARFIYINGNSEGWMGIRFNMNEAADKYCSFIYSNDRGFMITASTGKKYEIIRESKSTVIKAKDYNTLTIIKKGSLYKFLINDKQVHEAKMKSFFGPLVGVMTNQNMKILVDEIQVYDPQKGKVKTEVSNLIPVTPTGGDMQTLIQNMNTSMPEDFKQFYDSFEKFVYPYNYITVIERAHDITHLSFVQKKFFAYELSSISNHVVWAVAHLANCQNGYAFLVVNKYRINNQENTRFSVEAFDKTGKSIGSKDVGSFVKEGDEYFQTLDFKISKDGNSIFIEATETFSNGNKHKSSVSFNSQLCNL